MIEIRCSKCSVTQYVEQASDVMTSHSDDEGFCEGTGLPGKVIRTNVEPVAAGKNSHIIFTQPLEGQLNQ